MALCNMVLLISFISSSSCQYYQCSNQQCRGPAYTQGDCCDNHICVPTENALTCVNNQDWTRVKGFQEIHDEAQQAAGNRQNYFQRPDDFGNQAANGYGQNYYNPGVQNVRPDGFGQFQNGWGQDYRQNGVNNQPQYDGGLGNFREKGRLRRERPFVGL